MVTAGILPFKQNSHGRVGNRNRDLMISSQRLWPLDHEAGLSLSYSKAIRNSRTKSHSNGREEISWIINKIQLRGLLSPGIWRCVVSLLHADISSNIAIFMLKATSTTVTNLIFCNKYQEKFVEQVWVTVLFRRRFCSKSRSQFGSNFKRWNRTTSVSSEPATPV